ncbi:zinc-binding alcohol dehydrogenase family protein [Streptococcus gordonii]|jgi:oxidoreductase|uniref:zinc-binding alcohol dehydrogenase family protein n=1 Tax=Streptococcus gordonii TaxID=1302 RepID=UPI0022E97217|nr:zinc-binding alcohol dehydrogenase family protein [Streptococcus gordonii]
MKKMKAIVIYEPGGPEKLLLEERPIPELREGWTLVKVRGFGINHSEIFTRQGLSPSVSFPRILGIECVGQVAETTRTDLEIGQKVVSIMGEMGRAYDGSYAEYVLLPNDQVYPIETSLSWAELAAVPETYYTALGSLKNLHIKPEDKILVRAATSGVGLAFARLAKAQFPDVHIVGSVRSGSKQFLLKHQAYDDIVIDQDGRLETEEQFDKILELVGPSTIKNSFDHIAPGGIICVTGLLGGQWELKGFNPIEEIKNNSFMTTFHSAQVNQELMDELFDYIDRYQVDVSPRRVFSLEEVPEAHAYIEGKTGFGKAVIINENKKEKYDEKD